ncbi:MAG: NADH-quinone oxidoreductase subunit L [Spongiibacteraceae bacterium]|nr:NADH-quinone oxidoreductase subunit L [Spongiibacteraceae bacterium]
MKEWIFLVPLLPALSALFLVLHPLFGNKSLSQFTVSLLACSSLAIGFLMTVLIAMQMASADLAVYSFTLGQWFSINNFTVEFGVYIDALTLLMMLIITGVGALIHWFSSAYMSGDQSFSRYFAYLNLFIAAMLIVVMADNLLLLYLGWEGVGLCSFLLIGFWYKDPANGYAARKAFVVTRVGDTSMMIGLLVLFTQLGTLNIQQSMQNAVQLWGVNSTWATLCALLLLGGAVGKSAQLPLQTWLPDAMAGPTPVSALIHAATMVTAGVYLIARTQTLFELSAIVMSAVAVVGAVTLFIAGCSALVQTDIKRILAYSTMSQIGYMFYALGVGAWSAGVIHLMTHAFFKALLFLAAGLLIASLHHQQDIFAMGGLRKKMPFAFYSFLIGCCCLAAVPMTSGYFSKEAILIQAYANQGFSFLWGLAVLGAFLTSLYSFRLIFIVFFGGQTENSNEIEKQDRAMRWPLVVLSLLALFGALLAPDLSAVFVTAASTSLNEHHGLLTIALSLPTVLGIFVAYWIWGNGRRPSIAPKLQGLRDWYLNGWGFDAFYHTVLIKPLLKLAHLNRHDFIDRSYTGTADICHLCHRYLSVTQNGQLRWYVVATSGGAVTLFLITLLLVR